MARRFQGADSTETLAQDTILNEDMIQTRHLVGAEGDSDKGTPLSVIQSCPVAICETTGSTVAKVATVDNFSDFTLLNGREVLVYFANGNTATSPTFNLNNTGAYPLALENQASSVSIGSGSWGDGVFLHLKFVDITISGTQIQKWVICGHNIAQQTSDYTIYADGQTIGIDDTPTNGSSNFVTSNGIYDNTVQLGLNIKDTTIEYDASTLWNTLSNSDNSIKTFKYFVGGGLRTGVYCKYEAAYGWFMVGHYSSGVQIYTVKNNVLTQIL